MSRIIGINSSHDTSLCIMEDGEVQCLYEEERERRSKYYSPSMSSPHLHTIHSKGLVDVLSEDDSELIFASFDRRDMKLHCDREALMEDRLMAQEFAADLAREQLTTARLDVLQEEYPNLKLKQ